MPKRSEREIFGDKVFETNPFENEDPEKIYNELQWGNDPNEILDIEAPEALVNLGYVAEIHFKREVEKFDEKSYYLAVGADSNFVYFIPCNIQFNIPNFDSSNGEWDLGPEVKETHYISDKGGEECYYYHKHEKPYPNIWKHVTGICLLIPADLNGQRSYAVIKEGIVG